MTIQVLSVLAGMLVMAGVATFWWWTSLPNPTWSPSWTG